MNLLGLKEFRSFLKHDRGILLKLFFTTMWGIMIFIGWAALFGWALQIIRWVATGYTQRGLPEIDMFDQKAMNKYLRDGFVWQLAFFLYCVPAILIIALFASSTDPDEASNGRLTVIVIFLLAYLFSVGALLLVATLRYAATGSITSFFNIRTNLTVLGDNLGVVETSLVRVAIGIAFGVVAGFSTVYTFVGPLIMIPLTMTFVAYTTGKLGASLSFAAPASLPGYIVDDSYE